MALSDALIFLGAWISDPMRIAAITPSGQALAELITSEISADTSPVLELGPGTGIFTRALIARGVAERDLTLIELGPDFVRLLERRFPETRVLCMDAGELGRADLFAPASVSAVVSGLPLLSMPPAKVIAILLGAFGYLKSGGAFYQFTYGPRCPVPAKILDRLGLEAIRIGLTLKNIPPAAVYRIARRAYPAPDGSVPSPS
jgi:phosphatidylethanolamine/phosphatidyl-N-methylethanolamine N-methyltransferase